VFAKYFIKMAPAPQVELLVELKPKKNGFTIEVELFRETHWLRQ
jgi:hypothetical protein